MLHAYGGDMETDELEGPSAPAPAAGKKKAARPSKKARATSNKGALAGFVYLRFRFRVNLAE